MFKKRTTGNVLVMSAIVVCVCFAMLLGTTFAWFTSTSTTKVNTIVTGDLEVSITNPDGSAIDQTVGLGFVMADGTAITGDILWEPGASFRTAPFVITNTGDYDAKYKVDYASSTSATTGSLYSVLTFELWTCDIDAAGVVSNAAKVTEDEFELLSEETSDTYFVKITMKETAGNEYEDLTLDDLTIVVSATQMASETDSYTNTYDENADYDN